MASKNAGNTLAGKIAVRSMAIDNAALAEAAPLIVDAVAGTTVDTVGDIGAGVIAPSFDPGDFVAP
jgi:hypothetical protein